MPQFPVPFNGQDRIVRKDGVMSDAFRARAAQFTNNIPIVSSGSPEGAIEAPQYSLYIDETDPLNPVQYRKMLGEIGGDRRNGWVQV